MSTRTAWIPTAVFEERNLKAGCDVVIWLAGLVDDFSNYHTWRLILEYTGIMQSGGLELLCFDACCLAFSVLWTFAKCIESWCLFLIRILKKWEIGGMVLCYKECLLAHLPYIETPPRVRIWIFQWKASPTSCHENACGRDAASWKSKLSSRVWGNTRTRCHGYLRVFWLDLTRGGQTLRRYFWLKVTSKRCHSCMMFEIQVWSII